MIYQFIPQLYYNTIGQHPPILTIGDGDTVITTTIDARGWDINGESAATSGNPMTGPFYVEEAMPGDTLAVKFESITPNRNWAWTTNMLAPAVIEPYVAASLPASDIVRWTVEVSQGVAYLKEPSPGLAELKLPLQPFLGCFGVAPPNGQFISTATSGEYGGNMDYKGLIAGTTVYFPVSSKGALFYLGDGHALQGDGEIIGTGLEISMDVQFTVSVQKGKTIGWPRGETDTHWFCIGNARPLDQALQHATTEMYRLLQEDFDLTSSEVSLLLGQVVEYEIANTFNPAYSVVCKLPKSVLSQLKRSKHAYRVE